MERKRIGLEEKKVDLSARYALGFETRANFYLDEIGMKPEIAKEFAQKLVLTDLTFNKLNIQRALKEEKAGDPSSIKWIEKNGEKVGEESSSIHDAIKLVEMMGSEVRLIELRRGRGMVLSENEKSFNAIVRHQKVRLLFELRLRAKRKRDEKAQEWAEKKLREFGS